jgi:hypothetical protein
VHKVREVQDMVLMVKRSFLNDLKPGQLVLVNAAKPTEKTIHVQLTVVVNDPFNCNLTCENSLKLREVYGYEKIVEILSVKKRQRVLIEFIIFKNLYSPSRLNKALRKRFKNKIYFK